MGGLAANVLEEILLSTLRPRGGHVSALFKEKLLSALGLIWAKGGPYTELFGGKLC